MPQEFHEGDEVLMDGGGDWLYVICAIDYEQQIAQLAFWSDEKGVEHGFPQFCSWVMFDLLRPRDQ